jgi:3-oxoadipate enol-lactonase
VRTYAVLCDAMVKREGAAMARSGLEVEIVGRGRDLVCLHSLLSDKSSFAPFAERIADRRRLILTNMPGFGASPAGAEPVAGYADAVASLFDDMSLPPGTDVVGNGLGGFVALSLAARHGPRFDRAVLIGSAVAFPEDGRAKFRMLAERAEREGMPALADTAMKRMFSDAFIAANPELIADRRAVYGRIDPEVFAGAARALAILDFGPDLERIRNPILVVAGSEDGATPPALGRALVDQIAGAQFVELPGLGHCPHIQDPDSFVSAISGFLRLGETPEARSPAAPAPSG